MFYFGIYDEGYQFIAPLYKISQLSVDEGIVRPEGWDAISEEFYEMFDFESSDYVYRGMTQTEYESTVGSGEPIKSNLSYSYSSEGTSFSKDPGDAESYINFGRDDPRKSGIPTYLIEVKVTDTMYQDSDGYIKDKNPVPISNVNAVWEFFDEDGDLIMKRVR